MFSLENSALPLFLMHPVVIKSIQFSIKKAEIVKALAKYMRVVGIKQRTGTAKRLNLQLFCTQGGHDDMETQWDDYSLDLIYTNEFSCTHKFWPEAAERPRNSGWILVFCPIVLGTLKFFLTSLVRRMPRLSELAFLWSVQMRPTYYIDGIEIRCLRFCLNDFIETCSPSLISSRKVPRNKVMDESASCIFLFNIPFQIPPWSAKTTGTFRTRTKRTRNNVKPAGKLLKADTREITTQSRRYPLNVLASGLGNTYVSKMV